MKAIVLEQPGTVDQLIYTALPVPTPQANEVLIQVKAISINPVDVKTRAGKGLYGRLKELKPLIIGWDISGIVTATGPEVTQFKKGDEVFGMVNFPGHGQAYAEYVTAPASHLALKPANITHQQAAVSTLAALTAWQALVTHAKVQPGQQIVIGAASGGVGHFAVQLGEYLGAYVTGISSGRNRDFILGLGADNHLDYQTQNISTELKDIDFVLDSLGGDSIDQLLPIIKPGGTLISIPSGLNEQVTEKAKSRGVNGYFFLVQSNGADMQQIAHLLEKGFLVPHIQQEYAFAQMKEAHLQQETGRTVGKLVITV